MSKARKISAGLMLLLGAGLIAFSIYQHMLVRALVGMAHAFGTTAEVGFDLLSAIAPFVGVILVLSGIYLLMGTSFLRRTSR